MALYPNSPQTSFGETPFPQTSVIGQPVYSPVTSTISPRGSIPSSPIMTAMSPAPNVINTTTRGLGSPINPLQRSYSIGYNTQADVLPGSPQRNKSI